MTQPGVRDGAEVIHLPEIAGAYASDGAAELVATQGGLTRLAGFLRSNRWVRGRLPRRPSNMTGFEYVLQEIVVMPGAGLLSFQLADGALTVAGESKYLDVLGNNVLWLANNGVASPHLHVEYHDDHEFLAPSPVHIVVSFVETLE